MNAGVDYEVEYNNRARVPENPALIAGWARDAAAYLQDNVIRAEAHGRVKRVDEAPRGEVMYSVTWKEGSKNPSRVHVRTPTFAVMPAIRWMVMNARLADTPLIQASIDPCYSCTDR